MQSITPCILVVDDDPQICSLIQQVLVQNGLKCMATSDSQAASELLNAGGIAVLLTDIAMPYKSGLDLLEQVSAMADGCKVVLMTGKHNTEDIASAVRQGAYDLLEKPLNLQGMVDIVTQAIHDKSNRSPLSLKAASALQSQKVLRQTSIESILALARAVEVKDPYTRQHSQHVTHYALNLASYMGLDEKMIESVRVAALLHDIGKIGTPDSILTKCGKLTAEEFDEIRQHPVLGSEILENISVFATEAMFVKYHHERWDGYGYPSGLMGEETPLGARIICVADCMDAMLMRRVYKEAYPLEKVFAEFIRCSGSQFDPQLVTVMLDWSDKHGDRIVTADDVCRI